LISTPNGGVSAARNLGASRAKGNWLALCDADDLWLPSKLEKQLRLANEVPGLHCVLTDYAEITDGVVGGRSHFSYAPKDFWVQELHTAGFVVREPITRKLTAFQPAGASVTLIRRSSIRASADSMWKLHAGLKTPASTFAA
jgi:glycosyltransferase involved in cell wall biosynthesis